MGDLGFCHYSDIAGAVARQLLSDTTADGGIPLLLTRALHNKVITYFILSLRCYLGYFDTEMLFNFISPFLAPFLLTCVLLHHYRKGLLVLLFVMPLFFIGNPLHLGLGSRISVYTWFFVLIAIVGCIKLIRRLLDTL
jgi:hypothetical protein